MKTISLSFLITLLTLLGLESEAYAATITANAVTGNWSVTGSWSGGAVPTSADDVIIPSGATITIDGSTSTCLSLTVQNGGIVIQNANFYVGNLYINTGGVFKSATSNSSTKSLFWGYLYTTAATPQTGDFTITNNGQFGGTVAGTADGIAIFFSELTSNLTIDGTSTSTCYLGRLLPNNAVNHTGTNDLNLNIKQNLYLTNGSYGFSVQNNKAFTTTTTRTCTIFPSYTVTCSSAARFGTSGSTAPTVAEGNITYNIYGTLDLATNNTTYFDLYTTNYAGSTQSITVNLGNGTDNAVLKLGRNINFKRYYEAQSINLNWNNPNSKVVFGGNGNVAVNCSGYYSGSAYVDDARIFPSSIRNLSYENIGATAYVILPVKVSVTETFEMLGNTYRVYIGQVADATARTVTMGKMFYLNNNAYVVTDVSPSVTTVTVTTLGNAGTWVKGATLTDASGNSYYCEEFGITVNSMNFTGTGTVSSELAGAPIHVTGNVSSTFTSGLTARFPYATIDGNLTNGAGTMSFGKSSTILGNLTNSGTLTSASGASITIGGTLTNNGTVTTVSGLTAGDLINNGTVGVGTSQLTINGTISGTGTIDATTGTLKFGGSSVQTLDATNLTSGSVNNLTVNAGSRLTTSGSITATAINILSNSTNKTGTLINGGTLTNTNATIQQYLSDAHNWYVSSPVTGAVAPAGYTYYQRDEVSSSWLSRPFAVDSIFLRGHGYIALPTAAASTLQFTGTLNSGNINTTLTKSGTGYNLIGNPYPYHLGWTYDFVNANSALIESSIWTRTTTGTNNTNGTWSFATFNATSSESVPSVANAGIIPPMQAFWVKAKTAGTLTLDGNLTKSHQALNPLKAPALKKSDRQRLRLEISNGTVSDETLLYFDGNASNAYDAYDSPKFAETKDVQVYTTAETEKLVINGLNTITDNMLIPLGIKTAQSGTFTLKPIQIDNMTSDMKVYLLDGQSQTELELNKEYTFTSDVSDNTTRFSLLFKAPSLTTQIENSTNIKPVFNIYRNTNGQLAVAVYEAINATSKVTISNQLGQKLIERSLAASKTTFNESFTAGVYFVTVSSNGKNSTQKIIFN